MKTPFFAIATCIAVAATAYALNEPAEMVLAKVNGKAIMLPDLQLFYKQLQEQRPLSTYRPFSDIIGNRPVFEGLLEQKIEKEVLHQNAAASGARNLETFKALLEICEENMADKSFLAQGINAKITEPELRKKYDEFVSALKKFQEVKLRVIVGSSVKKMNKIIHRIKGGEKFAAFARTDSEDAETKVHDGSYAGWLQSADLQLILEIKRFQADKIVSTLKSGQDLLAPIRVGRKGWAIFHIDDRRPVVAPPFDVVREQLLAEVAQSKAAAKLSDLVRAAKIERFEHVFQTKGH
jgi:parvulin-like peptidyl-prolyl isomerase